VNENERGRVDTLLLDGFIYTMERDQPHAEAVAIRDGRICALGTSAALRSIRTESTRVVDLEGRMVMPGLIDGHSHPTKGAIADLFSCKFEFTARPEDIARSLAGYVARHPDAQCIVGGRWGSGFFDKYALPSR